MTDEDDPLSAVVKATLARRTHLQEAADDLNRRRLALWRMHNELRMSVGDITNEVRDALRERGLSNSAMKDAGVSYESIAKIVKGSRPENANSAPPPE